MQKFKKLSEWFEKDERTGEFYHMVEVSEKDGGKPIILRLGFDKKSPFNPLVSKDGYKEVTQKETK